MAQPGKPVSRRRLSEIWPKKKLENPGRSFRPKANRARLHTQ